MAVYEVAKSTTRPCIKVEEIGYRLDTIKKGTKINEGGIGEGTGEAGKEIQKRNQSA